MWQNPKTDWHGEFIDGKYVGDCFNAVDFNRIKNNLIFLRDTAIRLYNEFNIADVGKDKVAGEYYYADEINKLEQNLVEISNKTVQYDYGKAPIFMDNGHVPDFNELNRLERNIADLHNRLFNQFEGRRKFEWNFGTEGGL